VNAIDAIRNTPLHVFVSNNESICDESIMKLLCDAGAHLDYVNSLGETPFDLAIDPIIKQLLTRRMYLSLKCLCARLIQKNNIPIYGKFSTSLVNFVKKH
jgi:ankyrin repeat protein